VAADAAGTSVSAAVIASGAARVRDAVRHFVVMRPETQLPATFKASANVGSIGGGGKLTVSPGQLVFMPGRVTRRLGNLGARESGPAPVSDVAHGSRRVRLVWTRCAAPWISVSIQLRGTDGPCFVMLPQTSRRRLRSALETAGFDVDDVTMWVGRKRWS
jgi:hypothetical protein